jgi:negative regulator of sigma-B (phosphoserine phosphatase)
LPRGDLFAFATDGIRSSFTEGWVRSDPPQRIADSIIEQHFKQTDDALVMVVRYL